MSRFAMLLTAASVILMAAGLALVASTAHAVERGADQFVTSPRDVTNKRVLEQRTAERMGAIVLGAVVQVQDAMSEAAENASQAALYDYRDSYSDYAYSGGTADYGGSGGWNYTGFYPDENTGAFAYAPDLEITLGDDGIYRDSDGYVVVAGNKFEHSAFDTVDTPYGEGRVYDTGCNSGVIDVYKERWVDEG